MDLPDLPTDSLYKFMAISGLAMLAFFFTYPPMKILELKKESISIATELKILNINVQALEEDIKDAKYESHKINLELDQAERESKSNKNFNFDRIKERVRDANSIAKTIREKNNQLKIENEKIDERTETLRANLSWAVGVSITAFVFALIGSIICVSGFALWYKNIQFYQDNLLKFKYDKFSSNENSSGPDETTG